MRRVTFFILLTGCTPDTPAPSVDPTECETGFTDRDGDGFGNPRAQASSCDEVVVSNNADCNDSSQAIHPEAEEICDGMDNDCDGLIDAADDSLSVGRQYVDSDGDGFGAGQPIQECDLLPGYADNPDDCDDSDPSLNPDAAEICDGIDNNCDAEIDEEDDDFDFLSAPPYYADGDGDGFGGPVEIYACEQPPHTTTHSGDCDDTQPDVFPGAEETCDGLDNDCDGQIDGSLTTDGACASFEGAWSGPLQLTLSHGADEYSCDGQVHGAIDYTQHPVFIGSFSCDFGSTGGWDTQLSGSMSSPVALNGELEGSIEAFAGLTQDWSGTVGTDALNGSGSSLYVHSGVAYQQSFSFELTRE